MNKRLLYFTASVLLLVLSWPSHAQEWQYTVRPGDEIWNIARKYCGSATYAARIMAFNQISDERAIRPGQRLQIPIDWLIREPASAEIVKVRGSAQLHTPAPEPAIVGQDIEMGHRLSTDDGNVLVSFADGSTLNVGPESEVLFNVLTAYGDTGMVDTNLRFYRGRGTSKIVRRNDASRFRISTPVGTAAVRGTEFRVAINDGKTLTETLEGTVGFIQDSETSIPQGFGAAANSAGVATEPLLPAPQWISIAGMYAPGAPLTWQAVAGAVNYRVALYQSSDLDAAVQEQLTGATSYSFSGAPPGAYVVAVRGISGTEIEGYDSTLAAVLGSPPPVGQSAGNFNQESMTVRWLGTAVGAPYTVQVAQEHDFEKVVVSTEAATSDLALDISPGNYFWRVKDSTSVFGEPLPLVVMPSAPIGVNATSDQLQLILSWAPVDLADSYRVRISRDTQFSNVVVDEIVDQASFMQVMPSYGSYFAEIVTVTNGIESEPVTIEPRLSRKLSKWLLGLFTIPLLL